MNAQDVHFMKLALREAKKGIGRTSPNPAVGAVVVRKGEVVGKGYHKRAGTPHAEVHALKAAGEYAENSIIYITLEPCNHTGQTPPCTKAILASGVKRVVVGMLDPNSNVAGGGCDYLKGKGLAVVSGVLEEECLEINRPFVKHVTKGLPWVILKVGMSLDGRIATRTGQSGWITNELSRKKVHQLRDRVDAILVGSGTARSDDPSLTTRLAKRKGKDPLRVVLDTDLSLLPGATMLRQKSTAATIIFCGPSHNIRQARILEEAGAIVEPVGLNKTGRLNLADVLAALGKRQVQSVLVEGGSLVHASFIKAGLADQLYMFLAPLIIGGDGIPAVNELGLDTIREAYRLKGIKTRLYGDNIMVRGRF